jgi:hypothetical protein
VLAGKRREGKRQSENYLYFFLTSGNNLTVLLTAQKIKLTGYSIVFKGALDKYLNWIVKG